MKKTEIELLNRSFKIDVADEDVAKVKDLAIKLNLRLFSLKESIPHATDIEIVVLTALMLLDKENEKTKEIKDLKTDFHNENALLRFESLVEKIEKLAE